MLIRRIARNLHKGVHFGVHLTHYTIISDFRAHDRRACGKFVRRIMFQIKEVRRAASHFPSSKRGCKKLMIDDPSTVAGGGGGAIRFPQKMRNFLRPYTPKRFAATYNQRLAACRFMDCRVIRGNDSCAPPL